MALNDNPTLVEIVDEIERLNNLIVDRGRAKTITPSTSNKTLNKGYYKGDITVKGDSNLVASNIIIGKSIFGVSGSATVSTLGGKKWASGSSIISKENKTFNTADIKSIGYKYIEINNLGFIPTIIIARCDSSVSEYLSYYIGNGNMFGGKTFKTQSGYTGNINSNASTINFAFDSVTNPSDGVYIMPVQNVSSSAIFEWIAYE